MPKKIALAYSGGLDTSCIIPWLVETYACEVVAVVGDVGQGDAELEGIEAKAKKSGASSCHVVDLKREFIEDYVFPTVIAGSVYEGRYLLGMLLLHRGAKEDGKRELQEVLGLATAKGNRLVAEDAREALASA